jgi:O-antigen/teichoic acid export membrane protein
VTQRGQATGPRSTRGALLGSVTASFFSQGALVVTGVIVARTLGPEDRGYLALIFLVPGILQQVGTLGLPLATTYFIASDRSREGAVRRALRGPFAAQLVVLTILQAVTLWLLVSGEPQQVRDAAVISLGILGGALADMYGKAILQGQRRFAAYNVMWNGIVSFYLIGVVALFAAGQADLVTISIAWVLANLAAGGLSMIVALSAPLPPAREGSKVERRQMVRFGLKGFLGTVSPVGTFRLDQAAIGLFLAPRALGLYAAALAVTNLPAFISRGIATITLPQVAHAAAGDRRAEARSYLLVSSALTGAVVLVLEVTAGWLVPFFFGAAFEDAVPITRILLVGSFFTGVRRVLTDSASGMGRPGLGSIAELVSWIVVVPGLVLLMPLWGAEGVAAAITLSTAASLVALVLLIRRADERSVRGGRAASTQPQLMDPRE